MSHAEGKRSMADRFWGRLAGADLKARIISLVFVLAAIVAVSFCQLAFLPIVVIDGKTVNLMLILVPLLMGSFLFGPFTGFLIGLFAGSVQYIHALVFPLDFYEFYLMNPLNAFLLLAVIGGVSGWLFDRLLRKTQRGGRRTAIIAVVCLALSAVASGIVAVNTVIWFGGIEVASLISEYILLSPLGAVVQVLGDAALATVFCLAADAAVRKVKTRGSDLALLSVFRNWMMVVACIVFMISCSVIFSMATVLSRVSAADAMLSDVQYLAKQTEQPGGNFAALIDGFEVQLDGYTIMTDKDGVIIESNDSKYPEGDSLIKLLGYDYSAEGFSDAELASVLFDNSGEDADVAALQEMDADGTQTMNYLYMASSSFKGGYFVILRTSDLVYAGRSIIMLCSTLIALVLLAAVTALAMALLNQVVVRRIGETNESLEKITEGDLNERVDIHDTREFASLSSGINTTVSALKDTIEEVKQRNAQDLATAKAIQESALPTEFPAFPDIDKFDIYASMKPAREVGGDFYDFFLIDGTTKMGFVMADVSGKGIPAALFMMTAKTQMRNHMIAGLPLASVVDEVNHQLCIGNDAGMFVTAWVAELDYETGWLEFVNAGHNPPMLLHDGKWEWVKDVSGMPLGLFEGMPYNSYTRQLEPGDMVYAYTDGVTEAMNREDALFSEERLEETLAKYSDYNPRSVCVGVRRALTDFALDAEQSDDITMLGLKYGVPPEEEAVMVLDARTDQLVHVCNYIHSELHRRHAPKSVYSPLDIASEELFVNVCHYAYPDATEENPGKVRISFEYQPAPSTLTVQIADDGIPYNPLEKPDAVTPDNIADVPIGGLGILMAKQSVDEMTYERIGESNVLTFKKSW